MKISPMSVELVDHMGSDLTVVNAARVSFDKFHEKFQEGDEKLIGYLARYNHWTPFGHATLSYRIKAPIFVARQLVKHQVGLVWNEVSRRYVDDEPEFWFPKEWRGKPTNGAKQGSSGVVSLKDVGSYYMPDHVVEVALDCYNRLLHEGVAPEQARMVLPLNTMTSWIWTGSLYAFARVCKLRLDPHAQAETREVAEGIAAIAAKLFPVSWGALVTNDKTTID